MGMVRWVYWKVTCRVFITMANSSTVIGCVDDVQGESSYAFAAAGDLLAKDDYLKVSSNLLDYSFREYRDSVRNNPKSPSYGLLGWAYTHKGTYYGDDNARSILGSLAASAIMNNTSWDKQIVECIVGNFRTTGKNGFRGGNLYIPICRRRVGENTLIQI